ncbi:MAG: RluA family pseudouridine synthase, partial [Mogibacterium sp.]|nr:RluA family pseudouridine synthase [Mogibacterium sp.]
MREIPITANDAGRRLDRFLRKYLPGASLSEIYKIIRKDAKVDAKRRSESYILNEGEILTLYLSDEAFEKFSRGMSGSGAGTVKTSRKAKRTFGIIYEDNEVLIASKPYGLLTHGDSREKKDHLANQVKDYLIASGAYDPRSE